MKILILTDEVWNDKINGNNVTSNWFEGMNAEFANIYASPGCPYNKCCNKYFQITDIMMVKSIFYKKKAGRIVTNFDNDTNLVEEENKKLYKFLKSITGGFLRLIRELIWLTGRYDMQELTKFINDFKPDIVFSARKASCKMLRLEKIINNIDKSIPIFSFTGDDEYTLRCLSFSPFFWIRRFMVRRRLRKNIKMYSMYYMLSEEQKEYYEKHFKCRCKILQKCGEFKNNNYIKHNVGKPIKLIYAGKFYCNRWKVLAEIVKVLKEINKNEVKMILNIYTKDDQTFKQKKILNDGTNSFIKGGVTQEELTEIYKKSDIALHVESKDLKYRLATRFSYSTKIIDCIFSGCAVMAYCWKKQAGLVSLKNEDAAICVSTYEEMKKKLFLISKNTNIINEYSQKAFIAGDNYHNRKLVQEGLMKDFEYYTKD